MCAQEGVYCDAAPTPRSSIRSSNSFCNDHPDNMPICHIDRTPAGTWPCGLIDDDHTKRRPRVLWGISCDGPDRTQRDNLAEWKSGEGYRRSIILNAWFDDYRHWCELAPLGVQKILNCFTFGQIEMAIDGAVGWYELEPLEMDGRTAVPFVLLKIDGNYGACGQWPTWNKIVDYMCGGQECAIRRQKECRTINRSEFHGLVGIQAIANHGCNRSLYFSDSAYERTAFIGQRDRQWTIARPHEKQRQKNQKRVPSTPATGTYFGSIYSAQCRRTLRRDNMIIQCSPP